MADNKPKLSKVTFEFDQEEHCMSNKMGGVETIEIEVTSDLPITEKDGFFFVLKTEQWSFNDENELKDLLDKLKQSVNLLIDEKEKGK
jgi:hypothetical protein